MKPCNRQAATRVFKTTVLVLGLVAGLSIVTESFPEEREYCARYITVDSQGFTDLRRECSTYALR